jgi:hypothetical protein
MALVKATLKSQIKSLMTDMRAREENSDDEFADRLSTIIDNYVKSATITVPAGQSVSTTGTAVAQTGATITPINATIN